MKSHFIHGIYIHIPFCLKKCPYCDFYSEPFHPKATIYDKFILKELQTYPNLFWSTPTVYFGGGTPSLMKPLFFEKILSQIGRYTEVTIEANPATFDRQYLQTLKEIGINRFNLGIQTLQSNLLKILERPYSPQKALLALSWAVEIFENVGIDIIFAIPGQTFTDLEEDLKTLINFPIKHISAYLLTFYPHTPFYAYIKSKKLNPLKAETQKEMYFFIKDFLEAHGFIHYEISNFAQPGYICWHNQQYWELKNYLGLGAGAVSFYDGQWHKNIESVDQYYLLIEAKQKPIAEAEMVVSRDLLALKISMGLRMLEGINLEELGLLDKWEKEQNNPYLFSLIENDFLIYTPPFLRLGRKGLFLVDTITKEIINTLVF
jgi:oxygen-independent coproporphyrinogen-3 oxidase